MTREERIKELFLKAREAGTLVAREAILREACQDDPELRQQVESLLQAYELAGTFLGKSVPRHSGPHAHDNNLLWTKMTCLASTIHPQDMTTSGLGNDHSPI